MTLPCSGDIVIANVGSEQTHEGNASSKQDSEGRAHYGLPGALRISEKRAKKLWTAPDEPPFRFLNQADSFARRNFLIADGRLYCSGNSRTENDERIHAFSMLDLETGRVLATVDARVAYMQRLEDKLLVIPDWAHQSRGTEFELFTTDPSDFRRLGEPLKPPHPLTTTYQVYTEFPVIAGRIFLRTETGHVVCYDLRKPNP